MASKSRKQPMVLEQRAMDGMRDSENPDSFDPTKVFYLQNMQMTSGTFPSSIRGRPGYDLSEDTSFGETQLIMDYDTSDGIHRTVMVAGGKLYIYNWITSVWTEVTPITPATLPVSGRVYGAVFADYLIINPNDNANPPWAYLASSGVFTQIDIDGSSSPVSGKPVVYYAKLFFIGNDPQNEIFWSEEADPFTGYAKGGFNNAWQLIQTDNEPIIVLHPTNAALYYFRERSIGVITGAVTTSFQSTGVNDGISANIGCPAPDGVGQFGDKIFFISHDGRPRFVRVGVGVDPRDIWKDLGDTFGRDQKYHSIEKGVVIIWEEAEIAIFGLPVVGDTYISELIGVAFDSDNIRISSVMTGFESYTLAVVHNTVTDEIVPMHGDTDGYVYAHGQHIGAEPFSDNRKAGAKAIQHVIEFGWLGNDLSMQKFFTRIDVLFPPLQQASGITLSYKTPYASRTVGELEDITAGGRSLWDVAKWDEDTWAAVEENIHRYAGIDAYGRWIKPRILHEQLGEEFGIESIRVWAYPDFSDPVGK